MKIKHLLVLFSFLMLIVACSKEKVVIVTGSQPTNRVIYGVEKLKETLEEKKYEVSLISDTEYVWSPDSHEVFINVMMKDSMPKEGYSIETKENTIQITGNDDSGAMYACMDLIDYIKHNDNLPKDLNLQETPEMVLRGACVGVQKTYYLPGRTVYEYPYTEEVFPWFYDKELWIEYLDMLAANKMNSLYLWNGHPFASLVKLNDYPYAVEVDDETFKKNEEMYSFLTEEADKRGIWVIQMFYNILVSKPFAEHHGIPTQERTRVITPLLEDYTRKSVAAFIEKYPNVGLLICLGEAMDTYDDDVNWFTNTIIPGVKDGLKALNIEKEPPLIVRAHDTDCKMVMDAALPLYHNLYTMHKYNGESLTTYEPRGSWSKIHTDLSSLGSVHVSNVHILANLEPFRYGSPDFIQKTVHAMHDVHGANALHLYPQASYWDWPYTADKTDQRLKQIDRDWIWYKAWSRYAWNVNRDRDEEIDYWSKQLGDMYGCGAEGKNILEAYEQTGEIAPKLLRKFGITEGNRQTLLLGMFLSQLVNPEKWKVYPGFHESCGPEGEMLIEYMNKEWNKLPHVGETPPQLIAEAVTHGNAAVEAINKAAPKVSKNKEEFNRLKNDVYAYQAFANFFSEKVKAAMLILQYTHSNDLKDLEEAVPHVEKSLEYFQQLVDLTKDTYLYANSMQTAQRRIPIGGDEGKNKTWEEMMPHYQLEFVNLKKNIEFIKKHGNENQHTIEVLKPIDIKIDGLTTSYTIKKGEKLFSDKDFIIGEFAEDLKNMRPIRFSENKQFEEGTLLTFETKEKVNLLVGYLNTERKEYAKAPTLETNAMANDYGQGDVKLANAIDIPGRGTVNVHTYTFDVGKHTLSLGKGALMVLGFTSADQKIAPRNVGLGAHDPSSQIDWIFY